MTTDSKPPVRLGIAGCGNVLGAYLTLAARLHHQGLADVAVLCGRERQRAPALAGWPGAEFVTDYAELLARPDVDAIVLLTPMREHAPMARAALLAGKHVLVEKPMATDLDEARGLLAMARQGERQLVCAPFTVLSPTFQAIGRRLQRGDIGRVISARGRYGWAGPDWTDGLRHLVECIRGDARPLVTPEHAFHVLEVMLRAQEAGRDGKARRIESTFTPLELTEDTHAVEAHRVHDRTREE